MSNNSFDIEQYVNSSLSNAGNITDISTTRAHSTENLFAGGDAPAYGFIDWARDAASAYYRSMQEGEMLEDLDRMLEAQKTIGYIDDLLKYYLSNDDDEDAEDIKASAFESLKNLQDTGVWTEKNAPSIQDLQKLRKQKEDKWNESNESYLHNKEQYEDSVNNYDISQYYTRKSNEAVQSWGNWEYKLPATMGTSMTSPFLQTASMAGGFAGAAAGAKIGAAAGTMFGPGIGTVIGGAAGALIGLAGSQLAGGAESRENESHMEAFNGYYERVMLEAQNKGIDVNKIVTNVRSQLEERGVSTKLMDDMKIIQAALADPSLKTGSTEFNDITNDAYKGSRRLYERNNALGFGEAISDLSYILPLPQWFKMPMRIIGKSVSNAAGKVTPKFVKTALGNAIEKRFKTGLDVAAAGTIARNKRLMKDVGEFLQGSALRGTVEATEEGAQHILTDLYIRGMYDDEQSNDNFFDALKSGQVFADLADDVWFRTRSLGAAFGLDSEYKNDQQMFEEMLSGFLMSWTNPQGLAINAVKAHSEINKLLSIPKVSKYLQKSLMKQDQVNRTTEFFKAVREGLPSGNTWNEALDLIGNELKTVGPDGKTRKYNLDATVLTDDGKKVPSNEDIDNEIKQQKQTANDMFNFRNNFIKTHKSLKLEPADQDLFMSLAYLAEDEYHATSDLLRDNMLNDVLRLSNTSESDEFKNAVDSMKLTNDRFDAEDYQSLAMISSINRQLDNIDSTIASADTEIKLREQLAKSKLIHDVNAVEISDVVLKYDEYRNDLLKELDSILGKLKQKHADLDETRTLFLADTSEDYQQSQENQELSNNLVQSIVYNRLLKEKVKSFKNADTDWALEKIAKYKENQKLQFKLADAANEAARTDNPKDAEVAQEKAVEETTDKVQDMTKEAVLAETERMNQSITELLSELKDVLNSVPEDSYLYNLVDHLNKGGKSIEDNPLDYARYASRAIKRLKYQYGKGEEFENAPEDVKKAVTDIVAMADVIEKELDRVLELNSENKARAERHHTGFKNTKENSNIWKDSEGNRYVFDYEQSEYSENEGLILTMRPVVSNKTEEEYLKTIDSLEKQKEALEKSSALNPDLKEANDKVIATLNKLLEAIEDNKKSKNSNKIIINANENKEWLDSLTTEDNEGNSKTYESKLSEMLNKVEKKIAYNKTHRNMRARMSDYDGDVFDFDENPKAAARIKPSWKEALIPFIDGGIRRIKAYPLATSFGAKLASKLLNALYSAKYWHGTITMPYRSVDSVSKYFSKKDEKFERDGVQYSRYKAVETFNKIGGLVVYLTNHGLFNVDSFMSALESLADGTEKEIKVSNVTVTKEDYDNMIYALPLITHMYQPHTGGQATVLHIPDYGSKYRTTKYTNEEYVSRAGLVNDLLKSFKESKKKELDLDQLEGYTEESQESTAFENRVYFKPKDVKIVYNDFDYSTTTKVNEGSRLFIKDDGNQMTKAERNAHYSEQGAKTTSKLTGAALEKFNEKIKSLDYNPEVLKEQLSGENIQPGYTKLQRLVEGILKYGDGVISQADFLDHYVVPSLGMSDADYKSIKAANYAKMRELLEIGLNLFPDSFLSYTKNVDKTEDAYPIEETVRQALKDNWFNNTGAIHIFQEGEEVDHTNSDDNLENLVAILKEMESLLVSSKTADEFIQHLLDRGYSFKQSMREETALETLRSYFNNRKFSRLLKPSTIAQAITMGNDHPMNSEVNYENFNRITLHNQHKLTEIPSLGLTKDENGQYHYSIEKWQDKNVKTKGEKTDDGKITQTEYEKLLQEAIEPFEKALEGIDKLKRHDAVAQWLNEKSKTMPIFEKLFLDNYKLNEEGKYVPTRRNVKVAEMRIDIQDLIKQSIKDIQENFKQEYIDKIKKEIKSDDSFAGFNHSPLIIGYGSYENAGGAQIIYFDQKGNKHIAENATGKPGALYLMLPAFMNSAHELLIIRLNPKKVDETTATAVASILKQINDGVVSKDDFVNDVTINGFKISADCTYETLLNNIIYIGKQAIINDPSDNNYQRLLYIDNEGKVHFGERDLNSSSLEELVTFIREKKNFRIDREKITNQTATNGSNISIKQGDKSVFERKASDNYIATIVESGAILSDLNTSKDSRIFTKPSVYIAFENSRGYKGVANDPDSKGSAAYSKKNLGKAVDKEEMLKYIEEREKEKGTGEKTNAKDADSYALELFEKLNKKILNAITDGKIPNGKISIKIYDRDKGKVLKNEKFGTLTLKPGVDPEGGNITLEIMEEKNKRLILPAFAVGLLNNKNLSLAAFDSENNLLVVDDKPLMAFGDPDKVRKTSKKDDSDEKNHKEMPKELEYISGFGELAKLPAGTMIPYGDKMIIISGGLAQVGTGIPVVTQLVSIEGNTGVPSGYNGLSINTGSPQTAQPARTTNDEGNELKDFRIAGDPSDENAEDLVLPPGLKKSEVEDKVFNYALTFAFDDEIVEPFEVIQDFGSIDELYEAYLKETGMGVAPAEETTNDEGASVTGTLGIADTGTVSPLDRYLGKPKQEGTPVVETKKPAKDINVELPAAFEVLKWARANDFKTQVDKFINNVNKRSNRNLAMMALSTIYSKYIQAKYNLDRDTAAIMLSRNGSLYKQFNSRYAEYSTENANMGLIFDFLSNHVEKEDFNAALERTEKILGKNFDLSFLPYVERVYDNSREAMVYVFGQCASSGIRIFRDAKTNTVVKGSMYHESFHRVSLFILSKELRSKMYDDARKRYSELTDKSDRYVEEFLADRFADFVSDEQQRKHGKFYSDNFVSRMFLKLFDVIRKLINRFTKANITPEYVDMNKLFKDMYSGRYAYAKATKDNVELFDKVYSGLTPFAGMVIDGVEIAYDVNQYQEIRRDIIGRLVRTGNITTSTEGGITIDMDKVELLMKAELKRFVEAEKMIQNQIDNDYKNVPKAYDSQDLDEALILMHNLIYTYSKVLLKDSWKVWKSTIKDFCANTFKIEEIEANDPNEILNATDKEPDGVRPEITMSFIRDSYLKDMYASAHVNMKLLLWSIVDGDKKNPENMKFTIDGLMVYAKVAKLFNDVTRAVEDSLDVKDMLEKLAVAAQTAIDKDDDYTLQQFYDTISDRRTVQAIRNRVFTDFVRHKHNFVNYVYESEEVNDGVDEKGNMLTRPRYTASVRNADVDAVSQQWTSQWRTNIEVSLDRINSQIQGNKGVTISTLLRPLKDAVNKLKSSDINSIIKVLQELTALYGLKFADDDYNTPAQTIQAIMKSTRSTSILTDVVKALNKIDSSVLKAALGNANGRRNPYKNIMRDLFADRSPLNVLISRLSTNTKADPKTNSQRGPGGTKVYSIGAYNFITRLFGARVREPEWRARMRKNPYSAHSIWLSEMGSGLNKKVYTKLATVLNNDYQNSTADIDITDINDLLNKMITVANGRHVAPSLANKRFALEIEGFSQPTDVMSATQGINPAVLKRFAGYLADEIIAISDAMRTRQLFIDKLNEATKSNYTYKTFSELSSEKQEEIFRNNKLAARLLSMLVKQYHFKEGDATFTKDEINNRWVRRVFQIDLTKGTGYKFRHFGKLGKLIKLTEDLVNLISENVLNPGENLENRQDGINEAEKIANKYVRGLLDILYLNIAVTVNKFINLGIIEGKKPNVMNGSVDVNSLTNRFIPLNTIKVLNGYKEDQDVTITSPMIYRAIANYTINSMIDAVEFEKIVTGDTGYHKNITSVNKRYSGPVSTTQITTELGTHLNVFEEDRLNNSKTFNTVTVNTSLVINTNKFEGDMRNTVGVNVVKDYTVEKGTVLPVCDYTILLDEDGSIKKEYRNAPLVKRFLDHKANNRTSAMNPDGTPMTEKQLAEAIVKDAVNRFINYLNTDPTDASVFISAEMFRQLRQREGLWNDIDEAMYNLLEHYDEIPRLMLTSLRGEVENMCKTLRINTKDLESRAKAYDMAVVNNDLKGIDKYKGWIYKVTESLDATSLKYVYYGEPADRQDGLYVPIYDKMSLSPVFKIFADGHQMKEMYDYMKANKVDMIKLETAVKSGGVASFELFDKDGNFNRKSLDNAYIQEQYFELIGKQLNTDPHKAGAASLLTQFMKIAMMNIEDDDVYNVNGGKLSGSDMKNMYKRVLDFLTTDGLRRFNEEWGIKGNSLNKKTFMAKLQNMARTQNLPADTVAAFTVDDDGEFIINPAALPNIKWVLSRILSEMGKKIIDTTTPGMPLYQVASVGYDNIFNIKGHADTHLLMPGEPDENGNVSKRMQVKLSIKFFGDIIEKAKKAAKDGTLKGYGNMQTFDQQRRFILDNKDLIALSYRVPTQGQNSTIPIEIVDVFPPLRGAIISFPSGVTALTGSDFDIDKMFLARFNYEIKNNRLTKVNYNLKDIADLLAFDKSGKFKTPTDYEKQQLQNFLLDMYQTVLTSPEHYLAANTPLDVCTAPLSKFAKSFTPSDTEIVDEIPDIKDADKSKVYLIADRKKDKFKMYHWEESKADFVMFGERAIEEADLENTLDCYHLGTVFLTAQKLKNAGSDGGIGPMALNSVFRFFTQVSGLLLLPNTYLKQLGIDDITRLFDRNGGDILDITSALINAHVDAVKDNYIGAVNVNGYTYSITAFLTSAGFGNDTFAFLTQPILKEVAKNWLNYKNGVIGVSLAQSRGKQYLNKVLNEWIKKASEAGEPGDFDAKATPEEMLVDYLKAQVAQKNPSPMQQIRYLNTFIYLNDIALSYSNAISAAQIDTKKYGISADELISFVQSRDQFLSAFNLAFENPEVLYDNTFLGTKFEDGVEGMFNVFGSTIFEFSNVYKATADLLSRRNEKFGKYSKKFLQRIGPKIKAAYMIPFFNQYIIERFGPNAPLAKLTMGSTSVPGRFKDIRKKCFAEGIATSFFDVVSYNPVRQDDIPQFLIIDNIVKEDDDVKSTVQAALSEMFTSDDPEIRQWANDFAVYMFYVTAGTDTNAGGVIKTSLYDLVPPQHLSNISIQQGTYNQFVTNNLMNNQTSNVSQGTLDHIMMMTALTDDDIVQTFGIKEVTPVFESNGVADVIYMGYGSLAVSLRSLGSFDRFIKVRDRKGYLHLYKLGDISFSGKEGYSVYANPVYYRVATLGYRNKSRAVFSIRADGYVAQDGSVKSLLNSKPAFYASNFNELTKADLDKFNRKLNKVINHFPATAVIDYGGLYNSGDVDLHSYVKYANVDNADAILYVNDGSDLDLVKYAEFKNKPFYVLTDKVPQIQESGNILVLGNPTEDQKSMINNALKGNVMNKEAVQLAENIEYPDGFYNIVANTEGDDASAAYRTRTIKNAKLSDITIALAEDFSTAGENRTFEAAGSKYIKADLKRGETIEQATERIANELYNKIKAKGTTKNLNLNIAGNGLYSLSNNQDYYDTLLTNVLKALQDKGITISSIRSGGQSGLDEAGIKAADALDIRWSILAPKDYLFRDAENKTHNTREEFVARFENLKQHGEKPAKQLNLFDGVVLEFKWGRTSKNSYEVSTAAKNMSPSEGDIRFSAKEARFAKGTTTEGIDLSGMTIEEVYQNVIKKSRKGGVPAKGSIVDIEAYDGPSMMEDPRFLLLPESLKNKLNHNFEYNVMVDEKPGLKFKPYTKNELEDYSYYIGYLPLWITWAQQNPDLIEQLRRNAKGKTLTDKFAKTRVSQARALADILNTTEEKSLFTKGGVIETAKRNYTRDSVRKDEDTLYIFTDNTDRTSLGTTIPNGWYSRKYGSGGFGNVGTNKTTAIIRGLDNAYPISTMRYFRHAHKGMSLADARWKDSDIEAFKEVINDEIEDIKRAWSTGKYKKIVVPRGDGFFNSEIARISKDSEIGKYLQDKLQELDKFVNTDMTLEEKEKIGKDKRKKC